MRTIFSGLLASLISLSLFSNRLFAQGGAGDWPQFRGPDGLGATVGKLSTHWGTNQNIAWKTPLPGPGTSTPIAVGDRIYLTCYAGDPETSLTRSVLAIARKDGQILWKKDFPAKLPEQKNIREGHGYASNSLAIDGDRIFAFFGKSGVYALSSADGKQLWHVSVGDGLNGWGSAASPVVFGNLVIINASVESESLIALDKTTGQEVWKAGGIRESWNTPILVASAKDSARKSPELVIAIFGKILAFDPAKGTPLWSCATDIPWYMAPSLVAADGVVYAIGGRPGAALAVRIGGNGDVTKSHRVWTAKKGSNVSSPVVHAGRLHWAHDNLGIAYAADVKTGALLYEQRLDRVDQIYASSLLADGKIYHLDRNGRTFVLSAGPMFELLATNDLRDGGRFNASPAATGNLLLIRSDRFLYAIGQP